MIPEIERKAVLALFPYFSKEPIVVDVGANKGDWSEMLVPNVAGMILCEPNTILRHYCQVRFRRFSHVHYEEYAISDKHGQTEFRYFEDDHDGLSNIIRNPKWDYLHPKSAMVSTITLSEVLQVLPVIDFLKIDVEGAELKVLEGADKLLSAVKIKFIEVEKAEHIEVTGHTFQNIIDYLKQFGYAPFHYDGEQFVPYIDQEAENVFFMDANFTQDWNKEFIKNTKGMKCDFVLEIGCFEGLTSKYICENILKPGGRMICVDPLTDEYLPGHKDNEMFVGQFERFTRNTRGLPVELIRKKSQEVHDELKDYRFDLIYVDGDHRRQSVYKDGILAFELCRVHGFILFDDYAGYDDDTTRGIDDFVKSIPVWKYEIIHQGYQLLIRKLENLK